MATVKEINYSIMFGSLTNAELDSVIDAVKYARAGLQQQNRRSLRVGITVGWHSAKRGIRAQGTVTKIAQKYATVQDTSGCLWKVPMNMLEAA